MKCRLSLNFLPINPNISWTLCLICITFYHMYCLQLFSTGKYFVNSDCGIIILSRNKLWLLFLYNMCIEFFFIVQLFLCFFFCCVDCCNIITVSSANMSKNVFSVVEISMWSRYRRGPKTLPCETPANTG